MVHFIESGPNAPQPKSGALVVRPGALQAPAATDASSHQRYIDLFDHAPFGYLVIDQNGRITAVNQAAAVALSASRHALLGKIFSDFICRDDRRLFRRRLDDCRRASDNTPGGVSFEIRLKPLAGDCFDARLQMRCGTDPVSGEHEYRTTLVDISEQVHISSSNALLQECLELTRDCADLKTFLRANVRRLKTYLRCHSVGIRIADTHGKLPYAAHAGFSRAFLTAEKARDDHLGGDSLLTAVIEGAAVDGTSLHSAKGSLYLNAASSLLGNMPPSELAWLREFTVAHGYESVALIPIEVDAVVTGLLHCADRRHHRFPLGVVQTLEGVATRVGWALDRFRLQEELFASVNALKKLSSHLLTAQEEEQQRIAMELHDGCGQDLNALKLRLKSIEKRLPADAVDLRTDCEGLLNHCDKIINDVRAIAHDLKPAALDALGLVVATGQIMREFASLNGIQVEIQIAALQQIKDPTTQVSLFRIFQEALNNIQKHAQATWVLIAASREGQKMRITIRDNGKGFDIAPAGFPAAQSKGLGLSTMELRCRMVGGRLEIGSTVENGTQLTIWLPCHHSQES